MRAHIGRPATLAALALWSEQDRAGRAVLAPVSAALLREDPSR
jgi:hypothetical protein